jgi:hypothetical protein
MSKKLERLESDWTGDEWAKDINAGWRKCKEEIFALGTRVRQAKTALAKKYGDESHFKLMVNEKLDFSPKTAYTLMSLAENKALQDPSIRDSLPGGYTILRQLGLLSPDDLNWAIERGIITKKTSQAGAAALRGVLDKKREGGLEWGTDRTSERHLPKPSEANRIAAETGVAVAASDGKIYTGASEAETERHRRKRERIFAIIRAIKVLSKAPLVSDPASRNWLFDHKRDHFFMDLYREDVEEAKRFLEEFLPEYEKFLKSTGLEEEHHGIAPVETASGTHH